MNDSNESLVQLKDPKDKRRSKGDDPSISSFIQKTDPAETSKKTTNEAVKGKGKPNLPIVSPSDFFGTKGNKPTAVTTSKPLAKEKVNES